MAQTNWICLGMQLQHWNANWAFGMSERLCGEPSNEPIAAWHCRTQLLGRNGSANTIGDEHVTKYLCTDYNEFDSFGYIWKQSTRTQWITGKYILHIHNTICKCISRARVIFYFPFYSISKLHNQHDWITDSNSTSAMIDEILVQQGRNMIEIEVICHKSRPGELTKFRLWDIQNNVMESCDASRVEVNLFGRIRRFSESVLDWITESNSTCDHCFSRW